MNRAVGTRPNVPTLRRRLFGSEEDAPVLPFGEESWASMFSSRSGYSAMIEHLAITRVRTHLNYSK